MFLSYLLPVKSQLANCRRTETKARILMRVRTYRQEQWAPGKGRGVSRYPVVFLFLSIAPNTFCVNTEHKKTVLQGGWCSHLLLTRVADIFICVEKRPNVHGLAAPNLPVHCPIEREF